MLKEILERENGMKENTERVISKLTGNKTYEENLYLIVEQIKEDLPHHKIILKSNLNSLEKQLKYFENKRSVEGLKLDLMIFRELNEGYKGNIEYLKKYGFEFPKLQERYEKLLPRIKKILQNQNE